MSSARHNTNQPLAIDSSLGIDAESFRHTGYSLVNKIADFFEAVPHGRVTRGTQPKQIKELLGDRPLPQHGEDINKIFDETSTLLFNHSLFNGHPRFMGYITASPAHSGVLAEFLGAAVNPNVGAYVLSPVATEIETQTISWVAELIGYPKDCGGIFVSGGNIANFTGLLAARRDKADWDIRTQGFANNQMTIYCSKATHTWVQKAADLFGFGLNNIRWIDVNKDQQMNTAELDAQIKKDKENGLFPFVVVGTAGMMSNGVVDPLEDISDICEKFGLWFHVDGAYGAPAASVPEVAHLFKGIERADSVALDPHKWLFSPLEAGCVLVRKKQSLSNAFSYKPVYYNFDGKESDPVTNFLELGLQNSRGFLALKVWTALKHVGKTGYVKMISDNILHAKLLDAQIDRHEELQSVSQHLSNVNFRYVPKKDDGGDFPPDYINKLNEEIINRTQTEGEIFISNSVINEMYCLRACIVNFNTKPNDIRAVVEVIVRTGRKAHSELKLTSLQVL